MFRPIDFRSIDPPRFCLGVWVQHVVVELEAALGDLEVVLVLQEVFVHLVLRGQLVAGRLRSAASVNSVSSLLEQDRFKHMMNTG